MANRYNKDKDCKESKFNNKTTRKPSNTKSRSTRGEKELRDTYSRTEEGKQTKRYTNDPSWYSKSPELLRDSASVPFNFAAGLPVNYQNIDAAKFAGATNTGKITSNKIYRSPGIMALYLRPSLPITREASDPVNQAFVSAVSYLKHTVSATLPYTSSDLCMMLIGMGQIYSYLNFLQRTYALAMKYSIENRYLPYTALVASGVNPSNVVTNLADFRYGINLLISKASALCVPSNVAYFFRMAMIYSNIYIEGTSSKDQMYMYAPAGFWYYAEGDDSVLESGASSLQYVPFIDQTVFDQFMESSSTFGPEMTLRSVDSLLQYGEDMINRLLGSEDIALMSAQIMRAYGSNGVLKLAMIPEYIPIEPVFDIGILEQIHNASVFTNFKLKKYPYGIDQSLIRENKSTGWDVLQKITNGPLDHIMFTPLLTDDGETTKGWETSAMYAYMSDNAKILTTTTSDTSPSLIMESSRLMSFVGAYSDESIAGSNTVITGSELCVGCLMWTYPSIGLNSGTLYINGWQSIGSFLICGNLIAADGEDTNRSFSECMSYVYKTLHKIQYTTKFRFAPLMYWNAWWENASGQTRTETSNYMIIGNIDNYTLITAQNLWNLNQTAVLSMLDITDRKSVV